MREKFETLSRGICVVVSIYGFRNFDINIGQIDLDFVVKLSACITKMFCESGKWSMYTNSWFLFLR